MDSSDSEEGELEVIEKQPREIIVFARENVEIFKKHLEIININAPSALQVDNFVHDFNST